MPIYLNPVIRRTGVYPLTSNIDVVSGSRHRLFLVYFGQRYAARFLPDLILFQRVVRR